MPGELLLDGCESGAGPDGVPADARILSGTSACRGPLQTPASIAPAGAPGVRWPPLTRPFQRALRVTAANGC
jgi:hypothetical protein